MRPMTSPAPASPLLALGRVFFAVAVAASGVQQLWTGAFVRLVPAVPEWIPGHPLWARLGGVVLIAIGAAILANARARLAATVLAGLLLGLFLLLHLPEALKDPLTGFRWTNPAKTLAVLGGALLVAAWAGGSSGRAAFGDRLDRVAGWASPLLFGAFLLIGGMQHFVYAAFVAELVPAWLPGRPLWASFTGLALIAGGIGVWVPRTRYWAGLMSGIMIFLWVVMLHLPRALAEAHAAGETSGALEALALSGVGLMLAGTARGRRVTL